MKFRVARHTRSLAPIIDFYGGILGMEILGEFKNHHQYDGVFLGFKNADWHLEFTVSDEAPDHKPDDDDLLVFYAASVEEYNTLKEKLISQNVEEVSPRNPYWKENGMSFTDPDGFRVVISLSRVQ
jgi:catechol 2,3-dioxygenase-like lactoylglutathione lyase family enzyme